MNLKLFGRQLEQKNYLCKECMCKKLNINRKQYSEKIKEFRKQGCNLF